MIHLWLSSTSFPVMACCSTVHNRYLFIINKLQRNTIQQLNCADFWQSYNVFEYDPNGDYLSQRKMYPMVKGLPTQENFNTWWRHQMETFPALLALCEGNPPVTGGFPSQRLVTRRFDVFFQLCLNKRLSKQPTRRWFETPSRSLWRHCNDRFICYTGTFQYIMHSYIA